MQAEPDIAAHKTLAQAARERRDVVTGQVMAEGKLLRFVAGPDGVVVPDVARKLPGRGIWVAADRASVETAAKKNLFSRSAKAKLSAPAELADLVEKLLTKRVLDGLGLARRAGDLTSGFEKVMAAVRSGKAAWLIEASDGAADGRQKILNLARHMTPTPRVVGIFSSAELGLALGGENVIHTAFLGGRSAGSWAQDVERLAGFRPLLPENWREERSD
jgi:predicted RNA-binding protein YlxR (DUF448 family)